MGKKDKKQKKAEEAERKAKAEAADWREEAAVAEPALEKGEGPDAALKRLQDQLVLLQHAYVIHGHRGIVVLEGWDAAGKGGLIRRIGWCLDPRHLRVHSIGAPSQGEKRQHWMQRFWTRVPESGRMAIFDRSWYGRVLVERIEGFATESEWTRAYDEIRAFETTLLDEGIRIVKLLLDITPETQLDRLQSRYDNPEKRWKLTEDDLRNRARWRDYEIAYGEMVERTSLPRAPWLRIDANDKDMARIAAFEAIIKGLGDGVDVSEPTVPPLIRAFFGDPS
ncbi:AMP phosphotransferase [Tistrella mobilis]|uniref:polyphosphate kinase 2 family protein n=1 Tax=Tistrella mobilis TaxID=171437 RepID=UPI00355607CF